MILLLEENYKPFIVCELGDRTEEEGIQYGKEQYGKDAKIFIGTHLDLI